ncbi:NAD-dependent epimerase [Candidatus Roizmanbacteria bacterium RIFCSPHIGHO2_02_FULL_38_11]|uniref:NAD-dependent epimerase n=1 Tax=Candidatus Roizmanbacteria bacterium RIFCSPHIGHO2_02_FULL_38_11 TaxID=1802039 RepID=A0A1F7H324_9BACT|nr:MAG: NAD-dependent epimerase [Candidatus Roizmanbacteria bacterium RIFCSPHIGHO2_02_FULL_38_11]
MNKSTILVTGGAGFIGSYLVEELLSYNPKKIFVVDNLIRGTLDNIKGFIKTSKVDFIKDDIGNKNLMEQLISKSDYCFHLAALRLNACANDPKKAYEVMVKATFNLIEAAKKYKVKKIVYSSSASVYGLAGHFPTPEIEPPYDNKTIYGAAKLFGEQMFRSYHHMYGLDYVTLRYFNVYGPRMDTHGKYTEVMIKWLDRIREKKNPVINGDGSITMDFVYAADAAKANILALTSEISDDIFNIASGEETSLRKLLELLLRVNSSKLKSIFRPETMVNPVKRRWADISKAKKLLNFRPEVSLEEGLERLSSWYFRKKNDSNS